MLLSPHLHVHEFLDVLVAVGLPLVEAVPLVESDDEGSLLGLEQVDRLDRLRWLFSGVPRFHGIDFHARTYFKF